MYDSYGLCGNEFVATSPKSHTTVVNVRIFG